jgi:hypothetical protein
MKLVSRLILLAALLTLGVWLWTVFFPSPEKVIRKRLASLAADVSFSQGDGTLSRLVDAESVSDFFATNVEVNIDVPGHEQHTFAGRDEITQAALGSRQAVSSLTVKFPDVSVAVGADKQSAAAEVTVEISAAGDRDPVVQELKVTFGKSEGQWLINKVETVRTISQPALK